MTDFEKKLAERTQELSLAESTLAARSIEFETLQTNLKELDELREMKEVRIRLYILLYMSTEKKLRQFWPSAAASKLFCH